jgi:DNA-binding PadR family transcriptional regulator
MSEDKTLWERMAVVANGELTSEEGSMEVDLSLGEALGILESGPRFSPVQAKILYLLLQNGAPMYGLQIIQESDGLLSSGGVYTQLQRLMDKGVLVQQGTGDDYDGRGPERILYMFNQGYEEIFRVWLLLSHILHFSHSNQSEG